MKPKICLVCDAPNWAYDMIAQEVKRKLSHKYEFRIEYFNMKETSDEFYEFLEKNDDCDLIHFLWRKILILMESEVLKNKVISNGKKLEEYIEEKREKISLGVYDFLFLDDESIDIYRNIYNLYSKKYYVSTKSLFDIYTNLNGYKKPSMVVHDICDYTNFVPSNISRFDKYDRSLVVGWVGNGAFRFDGIDLKGFNTIIEPVIRELKSEGYDIIENYADRNERWRTVEEMPQYYSEIDLCLCTSIHEGTPRPALEAMACGVPLISTNVGIIPEAFGEKQQKYIIGSRKNGENDEEIKKKLKEKIIEIYNNRAKLKELSEENQKSIIEFDGGKVIKEFERFFDECLNG